jgi:imidazole glycerol-phosphate synthase subunit HisF
MNRLRIIPVLTIMGNRLVKTVKFKNPNYIGDPLNAIKIFNEKKVDELIVLDIEASKNKKEPNYKLIFEMAGEAFMPLGYGGGIKNLEQAKRIFGLGIEKVLNSVLYDTPELITQIANIYGAQSVVVSLDFKKNIFGKTKVYFYSGKESINKEIKVFAKEMIDLGAGEIIFHDIDREGTFAGYNLMILNELKSLTVPIVAMGGCTGVANMQEAFEHGANATAAGSVFIYRNNDTKSILINYPILHEYNL